MLLNKNYIKHIGSLILNTLCHYLSKISCLKTKKPYKPTTKKELKELIKVESIYLGDIDTSLITDMSELFMGSNRITFNGINKWDINGVKKAVNVFYKCHKLTDFMHSNKKEFKDITNSFSHHKHFMHEFQTAINSYDNHIFKPIKLSIKDKIILFLLATALFMLVLEFNFLLVILVGFLVLVGIAALFINIF